MKEKLSLGIFKIFLAIISIIPFSILAFFSRFLYFILFKVIRYRNHVVRTNIFYALPYIEENKFNKVAPAFYKHLSELIIEIFKGWSMSLKDLLKHISIDSESQKLLQNFTKEKRHIVLMLGHYGNWEWPLLIIQQFTSLKAFAFYSALNNKAINHYIKEKRERYGATMIEMAHTKNFMKAINQQASIIAVVADQSPTGRTSVHKSRFLSLDTPFFMGGEKIAHKLDAVVLYVYLEKITFAKYVIHLKLITDKVSSLEEGLVTENYIRLFEDDILQNPEYWLWSHKRWKSTLPY
ncbi:MAG: lysophospholipid acyltransferase family protein [Chitinophagales bacterium]|nr:lysophospholipid acyltransferase family protein [Chitinophagales bacterium]MCZ2392577.1 lysophospholipid acyltransferase family protein [Chitinophagales bacterium]